MRICVIDTETTGFSYDDGDRVCEYAHAIVDTDRMTVAGHRTRLCDPGRPIPPEARAVHHISDEEVRGEPPVEEIVSQLKWNNVHYVAAHNAKFDLQFLQDTPVAAIPVIDTWRCALHLWPDAPSHSNQVLRYWLNLSVDFNPLRQFSDELRSPHRALYDVCVTAAMLLRMLETSPLPDLARLSGEPVILGTCRFGKHRGVAWKDVPRDYLGWILRQPAGQWDLDVIHTARHYLGRPA